MKRRVGFLLTHPVQYYSAFFRELACRTEIDIQVYFAHRPSEREQGQGFGLPFLWDVDLTSGYPHRFLRNVAKRPAVGFGGYDTPSVFGELSRERFDLLVAHGWGWKCMLQAYLACKVTGTPVAVRSDNQLPQTKVDFGRCWQWRVKRLVYPLLIRGYDVCLPYGERSACYLKRLGGRNVHVIPHVVDHAFFKRETDTLRGRREELRRRFGVPPGAVCFLFCGKFEEKKRPLDLLWALDRLIQPPTGQGVHVLLAGGGALEEELQRVKDENRLPVTFAGFFNQGEIAQVYTAADVLVLPSDYRETWGLVVNEAMACGLPCIVSESSGCCPELVREGETGISFPTGSIDALVAAMATMLPSAKRLAMGTAAREWVAARFTIPSAADQFVEATGAVSRKKS